MMARLFVRDDVKTEGTRLVTRLTRLTRLPGIAGGLGDGEGRVCAMAELFDKHGGFRRLHSFTLATIVQLETLRFCRRFLT